MVFVYMGITGIILCFYLIYVRNKKLEVHDYEPLPFVDFNEKIKCTNFLTSKSYQILWMPSLFIYVLFFMIDVVMSLMRFAHYLFYIFTPLILISLIMMFRMIRKKSFCLIYILIIMQTFVIWLGSLVWEII